MSISRSCGDPTPTHSADYVVMESAFMETGIMEIHQTMLLNWLRSLSGHLPVARKCCHSCICGRKNTGTSVFYPPDQGTGIDYNKS